MTFATRPGGYLNERPLHFFWVLDCSGTISGSKIQSLNFAIRECIPAMQEEARQNPEAQMFIRVLTFSSGARWHLGTPTPLADFKWTDIFACGRRDMGQAMELLAEALTVEAMGERALPPFLVLVTAGPPTDDFNGGLKKLMATPWAKKAVRIGIAIGDDADEAALAKFIGRPACKPLRADNLPTVIAKYLGWALAEMGDPTNSTSPFGSSTDENTSDAGSDRKGPLASLPLDWRPSMTLATRPGGEMANRPLHFFWVLDCSGTMSGSKIQSLNFAIRECIPAMQEEARQNPEAQMFIRVLTFSSGARWHLGTPTPLADFKWADISAEGVTDMGRAMELLAEALTVEAMGERALPPVLVLITDGQPTDDFNTGLKKLMDAPWAKKAVRIGIAIGDDADEAALAKFIAHPEFKPLRADNAPTLARYIKWASTTVLKRASAPASQVAGTSSGPNIVIPTPPTPVHSNHADPDDVW